MSIAEKIENKIKEMEKILKMIKPHLKSIKDYEKGSVFKAPQFFERYFKQEQDVIHDFRTIAALGIISKVANELDDLVIKVNDAFTNQTKLEE